MIDFAINHMTVARLSFRALIGLARDLACVGVEVRNDLPGPLFDGMTPQDAGALARDHGLRILTLAEVKRFNDWNDTRADEARALMQIARAAGAEAVSLIPRNDNRGMGNGERQAALRMALKALKPMLADHDLIGLVEPLGFATCPLRHKVDTVAVIDVLGAGDRFRIVHDSFHHRLAGDAALFAAHTGIVHVSGVTDPTLALDRMEDCHRGLVDGADRLGNVDQIAALQALGWQGPVSFECFSPAVHDMADPAGALRQSMDFIRDGLARRAA